MQAFPVGFAFGLHSVRTIERTASDAAAGSLLLHERVHLSGMSTKGGVQEFVSLAVGLAGLRWQCSNGN